MPLRRPLRSVWLGNPRYLSVYGLGIAQAMGILGHWHRSVSLWDSLSSVETQIAEMRPDVIWTHMALWPPKDSLTAEQITSVLAKWKRRGTAVYLHDGDPKPDRKIDPGIDINSAFSIALVNRTVHDGRHLGIPALKWPYAAMVQREMAEPLSEWKCDLLFAGIMRRIEGGLYSERTELVQALQDRLGRRMMVVSPAGGDINNRMLVADVAVSAGAVLGFARPEVAGWLDTRCVQYCGAGGVLVHDDAGELLVPDEHYLKFTRSKKLDETVASVLECVSRSKSEGPDLRERAFKHVQTHHTWVNRVDVALAAFFGR